MVKVLRVREFEGKTCLVRNIDLELKQPWWMVMVRLTTFQRVF